MGKKILLIEPNYKNKYPPMSLMKLATYHKMLGDEILFFKGEFVDFVLEEVYKELSMKLVANDNSVRWVDYKEDIINYLKKGNSKILVKLISLSKSSFVEDNLRYYRKFFYNKEFLSKPNWDRIYITTLFTFYWVKTITTINSFKALCRNPNNVKIGGIAASLVPEDIEKETGIKPHIGLLDKGGEFDDNDIIIDHLPLDYSILNDIDYIYPEHDGYYGYMTRGCVNKCSFCAVPKLEPHYNSFISIKDQINQVNETYGEKRNLLLLDNNVLASEHFDKIIDEIKSCGFEVGSSYVEPNKYEYAIKNLKCFKKNNFGWIRHIVLLYKELYRKSSSEIKGEIYNTLYERNLLSVNTATRKDILETYKYFSPLFNKYQNKARKKRYVDFNQGVDARFVTKEKMKKLSEIPIYPLRVAFDSWKLRETYEKAIRLAASNGIRNMSNYLLYNYEDQPSDLYYRMKLNIELCEELNVYIYSFPMKYHPIQDPKYFRNRDYIGKCWNRKYIRAIQAILNATKGKIGRGKAFFEEAFGKDIHEFEKLLYMPETMIIYRCFYKENGLSNEWWQKFVALSDEKKEIAKRIIHDNDFRNIESFSLDHEILNVLKFYKITRDDAAESFKNV